MSNELICSWLGLSAHEWPPDHYTLLGLPPGEANAELIEEHVHQRLMRLRPYQLNHPDQVTEAMNRLARAFSCLTDADAKRKYDESLLHPEGFNTDAASEDLSQELLDPLGWMFGPWNRLATKDAPPPTALPQIVDWAQAPPPKRATVLTEPESARDQSASNGVGVPALATTTQPEGQRSALPATESAEDLVEETECPFIGRRGLGTRAGIYRRICSTRQLLHAWEEAGIYVAEPTWQLTKSRAGRDFIHRMHALAAHLEDFPPMLGEPGQAGFWVASLARQQMIVPIFRRFGPEEREALARDWRDGHELLLAHRRFLRQELRVLRQKTWRQRAIRGLRSVFDEHPVLWLIPIAIAGLALTCLLLSLRP